MRSLPGDTLNLFIKELVSLLLLDVCFLSPRFKLFLLVSEVASRESDEMTLCLYTIAPLRFLSADVIDKPEKLLLKPTEDEEVLYNTCLVDGEHVGVLLGGSLFFFFVLGEGLILPVDRVHLLGVEFSLEEALLEDDRADDEPFLDSAADFDPRLLNRSGEGDFPRLCLGGSGM